jgi:hypothetical protein
MGKTLTKAERVFEEVVLQPGIELERITLQEFVEVHGFKSYVHQLRTNDNEYPFITFMTPNNESKNIYFSKPAAEIILNDLGVEPYKDKVDIELLTDNFMLMWSETPTLNTKDSKGKIVKGYSWKLVSGNEGESLRTEFKFN